MEVLPNVLLMSEVRYWPVYFYCNKSGPRLGIFHSLKVTENLDTI